MTNQEKKQAVKDFCKFLFELPDEEIDKFNLTIKNYFNKNDAFQKVKLELDRKIITRKSNVLFNEFVTKDFVELKI